MPPAPAVPRGEQSGRCYREVDALGGTSACPFSAPVRMSAGVHSYTPTLSAILTTATARPSAAASQHPFPVVTHRQGGLRRRGLA